MRPGLFIIRFPDSGAKRLILATRGTVFVGWRLTPYPTYGPCGLPLIYSPCWLKLPVLVASKSLRRSRKAGAARMDAG
ncbi:hypothetical protein ACNYDF_10255 [Klebsiella aerogenes]|uniref:hypothetical protein n=1 Tax=Klebsiella aerogenes TaxID=548 RepID=UPI00379925B4